MLFLLVLALLAPVQAADCSTIPPDPTILASTTPVPDWLADGSPSLQGWDIYQKMLVDGALSSDAWIEQLITKTLPGLSAIIMEPPFTAFRYGGGGGAGGSNETAFTAAVAAFRRHGVKVLIYSSLVHKGEDAEWANGSLAKHHPDWDQRLRNGSPATLESKPMLSPANLAAVNFSLHYTLDLLQRYGPADGVYLDNNQLGGSASDPADYSDAALAGWRQYLSARFSAAWIAQCLGYSIPTNATIPDPPSPPGLGDPPPTPDAVRRWGVWLRYRQRVMAIANEAFRSALHAQLPTPLALIAGNEVQFPSFVLATELQLYHEDAALTESYDVEEWSAAKPLLMRGLAASPIAPALVGLFGMVNMSAKPEFRLRSSAALAVRMLGAAWMARTKPHLSYYGLQRSPPDNTQQAVAAALQWYQDVQVQLGLNSPGLQAAPTVGAVLCRAAINFRSAAVEQSDWSLEIGGDWLVKAAQSAGAPGAIISASNLDTDNALALKTQFGPWMDVLLLQNATVLSAKAGAAIARFAKAGGTVISTRDSGTIDELGRPLPGDKHVLPSAEGSWGSGKLIFADKPKLAAAAAAAVAAASWQVLTPTSPRSDWQFMPFVDGGNASRLLVHVLYLGADSGYQPAGAVLRLNTTLELLIPRVNSSSMVVHSPVRDANASSSSSSSSSSSFENAKGGVRVVCVNPPVYFVVELKCNSMAGRA
jgi:hypothetical protein